MEVLELFIMKLHEHNYNRVQQFRNEVEILTKLRHPNLVVLYGCTSRQSRELLLVHEYVPNGTVADHLHGEQANPYLLTWPIRMNIAIETASALVYLHTSEIIHRDVKTTNILLDHNFGVKVADLGLSRLIPNNVTHVSTAPQGTPGYVDPQYHQRYQLTEKKSFSCPGLIPFKYPFYNVTDTRCGLIKVHCTSKGGEIQFGGRPYEVFNKLDIDYHPSLLFIWSRTFEQLVKKNSCEALMNNFTSPSPSPLLYSISLFYSQYSPIITLFKCTKNVTYFEQHNYKSYNSCKDHTFYFNYWNRTVPSDLPQTCQVVQLPVKWSPSPEINETNIFSLLSPFTSIFFNLSHSCSECQKKGRLCDTKNGSHDVQCLEVKREKPGTKQASSPYKVSPSKERTHLEKHKTIKILVITGSALILILSLVIFIIWRLCKSNPFSYVSSKNKSTNLEDIGLSCGVSFFSYKELEDATQNFDPSHELGDGGFGAVYYAPQGTPGYLDPQYHQRYQLTDKSDVYSFGVVLIELISSMVAVDLNRSQDEIGLANLAINRIKRCEIDELIDPVLGSVTNPEIMNMITLVAELAFRCLQYDSDMRPTMNEVLDVLMDIQAVSRIDTYDSNRDLQTVNVTPLSEANDAVGLLKDFLPSPVSVTSEWQSNNSASTTLSGNGDDLTMKNDINT
uniref:Putative concanavalin A-like lectin/glucanase domain, Serine/threonine-protein kinase, Ulk1/Ulk2 n=1 Tax=Helianthus annuus TaxID=4232 RepID=A0A251S7W1_HELAN